MNLFRHLLKGWADHPARAAPVAFCQRGQHTVRELLVNQVSRPLADTPSRYCRMISPGCAEVHDDNLHQRSEAR